MRVGGATIDLFTAPLPLISTYQSLPRVLQFDASRFSSFAHGNVANVAQVPHEALNEHRGRGLESMGVRRRKRH
jgi:hypothetical protein